MNDMSDASAVEMSLIRQAMQNKIPINASFELLPLCNMDCEMCYVHLKKEEMEQKGKLRTKEEWLSLAGEMKEAGTLFLLLTGGEPLLYPDFRSLYISLRKLGMILTVNTNGTLINEDWADFFARHKPRRINLTLYGTNAETYRELCHYEKGYDKALHAVSLLKERGVDVKIGYSAVSKNRTNIQELLSIGEKQRVPIHIDSYMYPATRERTSAYQKETRLSPEDAAEIWYEDLRHSMPVESFAIYREQMLAYTEHLRTHPGSPPENTCGTQCMAGNCSFTINWQGEMRPCVMLTSPSIPVFETGFQTAWDTLQKKVRQIPFPSKCFTCDVRPFCRICPAAALYETGSFHGIPDYLCQFAKASCRLLKEEDSRTKI